MCVTSLQMRLTKLTAIRYASLVDVSEEYSMLFSKKKVQSRTGEWASNNRRSPRN